MVSLETDKGGLKNSVMTFYRIRERNLQKMIEKNSILLGKDSVLYKREEKRYNMNTISREIFEVEIVLLRPLGSKEMRERAHPPNIFLFTEYNGFTDTTSQK